MKATEKLWGRPMNRLLYILFALQLAVFWAVSSIAWSTTPHLQNRLAGSPSPYLRGAATSPVHWQPWGEQAFKLAREMDRPILLDIGAIWCHWCHVMDEQTYANATIAKLINENFIPIKVDRDARPDIDERFQLIVSALTRQGGWPLTVFMTPEGHVFFGGGTFFPQDRFGRPGFRTLLPRIAEAYRTEKARITADARAIYGTIESNIVASVKKGTLSQDQIDFIERDLLNRLDPLRGGVVGSQAQFPRASLLNLAMELSFERGTRELRDLVETTLEAMARGGIRDQLGGGFHRYSTDPLWIVPHFEQMDYVQAQLLKTYALAYQWTGKPLYREVVEGILRYVNATLLDTKNGGFYAHQDADMGPGDDGGYFTWSAEEVREAVSPAEAEILLRHFDIEAKGEMREDPSRNVLWVAQPAKQIAKEMGIPEQKVKNLIRTGKKKLLKARERRKTPPVDHTKYAGRNGLMITGYLEAYKVFGDERLKQTALKALEFLLRRLYRPNEGMSHAYTAGKVRPPYLLIDQVFVAQALLKAFEVTGATRYLKRAQEMMDLALQRLWDNQGYGFHDRVPQQGEPPALGLPMKTYEDKEMPGPNALASLVLDRLYDLTNRPTYREKAEATLQGFAGAFRGYGLFAASYGLALLRHMNHPPHIVIIGSMGNAGTQRLREIAFRTFRPGKLVSVYDPQRANLNALPPAVRAAAEIGMKDGQPKAYVCVGPSCAPPTSDPKEEAQLIRSFGRAKARLKWIDR